MKSLPEFIRSVIETKTRDDAADISQDSEIGNRKSDFSPAFFKWRNIVAMLAVCGLGDANVHGVTPYVMSTGDYSEGFADIANWTDNFASGTGANRWSSVAVNAVGSIPSGAKITFTTAAFKTGSSEGPQRGSSQSTATTSILLLATGSTDNSDSMAIDLFLDFTGRNAGTLSFDYATVFNSTGNRASSLRVYTSVDGTAWTELSGAAVLNFVNNVAASGSITSVALPSTFNGSSTARIRFYEYNGTGGTTGSRPKISIDNVAVTSTASGTTAPTLTTQAASSPSTSGATLNGTVTADGGAALTDRGFYWQTTPTVTTSGTQLSEGGTSVAAFSKALSGLSVNTIYYYRAYAVNSVGTGLGASDVSFYTLANTPSAPTVGTPTSTTLNVAIGGGDGNPAITTYAIKEAGGQFVQASGALGASAVYQTASTWGTKTVTGLSPSTSYSFTVQAKNGDGVTTSFGSSAGDTTSAGTTTPSVTTQAASSLATSSATLNGTVTSDGSAALTDRGFYWQTTPAVTIGTGTQLSEGGTSVAAFSKSLGSLSVNTIYYYRAYAVNSVGTTLGSSDVSFYTFANTPSAPTVNGATPNSLNISITAGDGNPAATVYAIQETTSGNYVQANGAMTATVVYQTASTWGTKTVTNLSTSTTYTFAVVATNGAGTATSFSSTTSGTTQVTPLAGWFGPWSGTAASPLDAPTINANLSSAQLARVGLAGSSSTARYSSSAWNSTANYLTATLTAASGYVINLNSAALTGNWGSSGTGPASFDVRSSVDNYASSIGTVSSSTGSAFTSVTLPSSGYNTLSSITFRFIGSATAAGGGATGSAGTGGPFNFYVSGSVVLAPSITGAATASAFTTTYGTVSAAQTFSVSGANLIADLIATAPTGFEVSSDGTTYGTTATFAQSGGSASGSLRIRLAATATVSGSYDSKNIALTSSGATTVNITTASSGNTVNPRAVTLSGSRVYDGTATAAAGILTFGNNLDGGNLTLSGSATLSSASGGLRTISSFNGLTLGGSAAGNYTLTGASGSVRINPAAGPFVVATTKNTPVTFLKSKLIAVASDAGVTLSVGNFPSSSAHGTLSDDATSVTYTPTPSTYTGSDSFTYTLSDDAGGSTVGTVDVTVRDANTGSTIGALDTTSDPGHVILTASGKQSTLYKIQKSDDSGTTWTDYGTATSAANGVLKYTDMTPNSPVRFYRLAQ